MAKRKPFGTYNLLDCEPEVALVRYDGDPDVFTALAWVWLMEREDEYEDGHYSVEPPQPRLYRMNPCADYEYSWTLGRPAKRGPGVFTGSVLTRGRNWICGYCFAPTPDHFGDCVTLRRAERATVATDSSPRTEG